MISARISTALVTRTDSDLPWVRTLADTKFVELKEMFSSVLRMTASVGGDAYPSLSV